MARYCQVPRISEESPRDVVDEELAQADRPRAEARRRPRRNRGRERMAARGRDWTDHEKCKLLDLFMVS